VFYYWAGFVVFSVLMVISLIVLIIGICLPKHVEEIGERGGESWE
jgi:competence protein ComGC